MPQDTRTVAWDINNAVIAANNGDGTFGSAIDVKGVVSVAVTINIKSGEQMGDGGVYSVLSKATKGTVKFQFADQQSFAVLQVIRNKTKGIYGSNPTVQHMGIGTEQFPYFALAGQTYQDDGTETFNVFMPNIKVTSDFDFAIAENSFVLPEFTCTAVPDSNWTRAGFPQIAILFEYPDSTALTIPPTNLPKVVA
jgi:hypothetical protein